MVHRGGCKQDRAHHPLTGTITEFAVPSDGLQLTGVTSGPDGNIWFCQSSSTTGINKIDKMTPAGTITEEDMLFTVPPNTGVSHIHPGPDHTLWFTGFEGIERVTLSSVIPDVVPAEDGIAFIDEPRPQGHSEGALIRRCRTQMRPEGWGGRGGSHRSLYLLRRNEPVEKAPLCWLLGHGW